MKSVLSDLSQDLSAFTALHYSILTHIKHSFDYLGLRCSLLFLTVIRSVTKIGAGCH